MSTDPPEPEFPEASDPELTTPDGSTSDDARSEVFKATEPDNSPVAGASDTSTVRKVLNGLGALVAIALAVLVLVVYYSNTSNLEFIESLPTIDAEPGTELTVTLPEGVSCAPKYTTIYRSSPLGRWQQTHSRQGEGFIQDRREMWHTDSQSWDLTTECDENSRVSMVLPENGLSDEFAVCEINDKCLRITIDN